MSPKLVTLLCCSWDRLVACDVLVWLFSCLKPVMTFSPILSLPILYCLSIPTLLSRMIKRLQGRESPPPTTIEVLCRKQESYEMKPWESPHLLSVEDMKHFLPCFFWLFQVFWVYHSMINNHPWLSKTFDAYSVVSVIPSIISFRPHQIFWVQTPEP
jgi:hypothetical protein